MIDSKDEMIATVTAFKFDCNIRGKGGHNARDSPQLDMIKCKHCGWLEDKKETCWKVEENKSKRPEWWIDTAAESADEDEIIH